MKEDDFWDIDKLLPHKPAVRPTPRSVHHNISMSEINSGKTEDRSVSLREILKTSMPPAKETQIDYSEKSIILCNAVIADRIDSFSYSDKFLKSAHE
ncbi:MAG: hypothetical protein IJO52_03615, partial [Clostridia bacterium]|nr:hypothetical protein [Clostridia bacterium]